MNPRGAAVRGLLWAAVLLVGTVRVAWAQAPPEAIEYYARDAVGSVRIVFDAQGNVLGRSDYLPFGETWNQSGALPRQRFTGQARDGEAGLDDFNARAYQPLFGRFTRPDPVYGNVFAPQSWNAYAYVQNRPLVATDPSGMQQTDYYVTVVGQTTPIDPHKKPPVGPSPQSNWEWWGFLGFYTLNDVSFDEYAGFNASGVGVGGPVRPSTGTGEVVDGDSGQDSGQQGHTQVTTPKIALTSESLKIIDKLAKDELANINWKAFRDNREYCFSICRGTSFFLTPTVAYSDLSGKGENAGKCTIAECPTGTFWIGFGHAHDRDGNPGFSGLDIPRSVGYWYMSDRDGSVHRYSPFLPGTPPSPYSTLCTGCAPTRPPGR